MGNGMSYDYVPSAYPAVCGIQREADLFTIFFLHKFQLELITELLGTPSLEDMRYACAGARAHMLRRAPRPPALAALYTLSVQATHEAVHLLAQVSC